MRKVILLLVLNIALCSTIFHRRRIKRILRADSGSSPNSSNISTYSYTFLQKLDHFNKESDQKWYQRYWASTTYYKFGGPAFLLVNGEWRVDDDDPFSEAMISYAKELNASIFSLEHRYYGESWPGNENLNRLSTVQAIADIAYFIKTISEKLGSPKDTKWILFGCSYAGSLAAWARLKYPHLIHGTVASSAALEFETQDYYQLVEESLKSHDPKCIESITQATEEMAALINSTENTNNFSRIFRLCETQNEDIVDVITTLVLDMAGILSEAVQFNDSSPINIPVVCDIMINHNGTKLKASVELRRKYIEAHKDEYFDSSADRSWDHQSCSELGSFINFNQTSSLSALSYLIQDETFVKDVCEPFFGPNFGINELNKRIMETHILYGGLDFNVENTLFIHGSTDPWRSSGHYKQKKGSVYETIFINGTSHCSDIYLASDEEIPEMKKAREQILEILKKWLNK